MATTQFNFRAYINGIDNLYTLAQHLGYIQTRGGRGRGGKGEGSPKLLMEAIAAGNIIAVPLPEGTDPTTTAARLRHLAANAGPDSALITALADALASRSATNATP